MKKILVSLSMAMVVATVGVSAKTVATVNGMVITSTEVEGALDKLTKGQKSWSDLSAKDKEQLITMMAPAKLVAASAKKGLSTKEKEAAVAGFWMQKQIMATTISEEEMKKAYESMQKRIKDAKSTQKIPAFEVVKNSIKMQLAQEKVVGRLMKSAVIKLK